jgi:hypothetical protein
MSILTNFNTGQMKICQFREIRDDAELVMLSILSLLSTEDCMGHRNEETMSHLLKKGSPIQASVTIKPKQYQQRKKPRYRCYTELSFLYLV